MRVRPWWRTEEGPGRPPRMQADRVREEKGGSRRRVDGEAAGGHRRPDRGRPSRRTGLDAGTSEDRQISAEEKGGVITSGRDQDDTSSDPFASRGKLINGGWAFPLSHADRMCRGRCPSDEIDPKPPSAPPPARLQNQRSNPHRSFAHSIGGISVASRVLSSSQEQARHNSWNASTGDAVDRGGANC